MDKINCKRAFLGGIVAGFVLFVIMGIVNGLFLGSDWNNWKSTIGALIQFPNPSTSMMLWFFQALVSGQVALGIYAAIRPRFGAGPQTAIKAGLILWTAEYFANFLNQTALGILPSHINVVIVLGALAASIAATLAGASIYKE
jgi:hypothetical protein